MSRLLALLGSLRSRVASVFRWMKSHVLRTIAIVVTLLLVWTVYAVTRPKTPEYVTAVAERGDIRQLVEAVGTVTSERALELQFPLIDTVSQVYVTQGMKVKAGQKLAQLRSGSLSAGVASASASVQSAQAALDALLQGARPEDIAVAEAQVANKRASLAAVEQTLASAEENLKVSQSQLDVLRSEARTTLSGQVSAAGSTVSQQLATSKTAILAIQGVFNANDVQDALVKSSPADFDSLRVNMTTALSRISLGQSKPSPLDYQQALALMNDARLSVSLSADIANRAYDIVSNLPLTAAFTNTSKETNKSTIATQKSAVQTALTTLDAAIKSLQDASAGYDTKIAAQQSTITTLTGTRDRSKADIETYRTSLAIDEASLALKKAPARQTDVSAAQARVRQAQADLARAAASYNDTVLTAPVDGVITQVNVKPGQVRPSDQPSVTMLGDTPFRVEMFISEVDIPKVKASQSGSIKLDAFRDQRFPLRVAEIDSAATDKDGVPKYRVKLDFAGVHDDFKVGMTGDAEIVTGQRSNVVSVPLRSVLDSGSGSFVRILTGKIITERPVVAGMEGDGGVVEVTGVSEGETVIVLEKK